MTEETDRITELGQARADDFTGQLLDFVEKLETAGPEPFIPLLTDIALARALIVHLVIRYGPERGLKEARDAFDCAFEELAPLIENLEEFKERKPPKGVLPQ